MIEHVFFDLDRTLWDFDKNSELVITQLLEEHAVLSTCNTNAEKFIQVFREVNDTLWSAYRKLQVTKEELRSRRFYESMLVFGMENSTLAQLLEREYIARSPQQTHLILDSIEVLEYLKPKYTLHIITNGFKEVQLFKLANCGLDKYFKEIIISEDFGCNKPDIRLFKEAQKKAGASPHECLMIGDDLEADVIGAQEAGMHAIYFNPVKNKHATAIKQEIDALIELKKIL